MTFEAPEETTDTDDDEYEPDDEDDAHEASMGSGFRV
jgi:hypothetical protein